MIRVWALILPIDFYIFFSFCSRKLAMLHLRNSHVKCCMLLSPQLMHTTHEYPRTAGSCEQSVSPTQFVWVPKSSILSLFPPLAGPLRFLERFPIPPATIRPGKPKKYTTQYKTDLSVYIEYEPTV